MEQHMVALRTGLHAQLHAARCRELMALDKQVVQDLLELEPVGDQRAGGVWVAVCACSSRDLATALTRKNSATSCTRRAQLHGIGVRGHGARLDPWPGPGFR